MVQSSSIPSLWRSRYSPQAGAEHPKWRIPGTRRPGRHAAAVYLEPPFTPFRSKPAAHAASDLVEPGVRRLRIILAELEKAGNARRRPGPAATSVVQCMSVRTVETRRRHLQDINARRRVRVQRCRAGYGRQQQSTDTGPWTCGNPVRDHHLTLGTHSAQPEASLRPPDST